MSKRANRTLAKMLYSAMFLSLALLLPFLTSQIPEIGSKLLPMHLPVILCGFVCGPFWGMTVGASAPILRSLIFTRPEIFPSAVTMAVELATYAFVAGFLYKKLNKNLFSIYFALITAMVCGRLMWGGVMFVLIFLGMAKGEIGFSLIWARTVLQGVPGITIQIIAIPIIVNVLKKNRLMLN